MIHWILAWLICAAPIAAEMRILALSGSTREDSHNKKLLREAVEIARNRGATVTVVDLKDYPMPFYDGDLEKLEGMPPNARALQKLMIESDGILISSPEYNHSFPAVLKNALDWASKNEQGGFSKEAFRGKKFALMSASPGKKGGAKGLLHLADVIEDLDGEIIPTRVSVGRADQLEGFKSEAIQEQLEKEIGELLAALS